MKKITSLIFLCTAIHFLGAMELQRDKQKIDLKLVSDSDKIYTIARWKVMQESSQADVLDVPGLTEQEISHFDKELDTIDATVIQDNKDALKLEIKKRILSGVNPAYKTTFDVSSHYPVYKVAFDYLLVSMIAENIRNNRVKAEEAYPFESKLVQKLPMGDLHMPSVDKLEKNSFAGKLSLWNEDLPDNVMATMPFSTMAYTGLNTQNGSCVSVRNQANNGLVGQFIGMVRYNQKNITGLGFTNDLRYLVATFDDKLVSKAALYNDEDYAAYKDIRDNIKLADIYLLFHLYQAKKQGLSTELQNNEHEYVRDHVAQSEKGKELIQKHFLS